MPRYTPFELYIANLQDRFSPDALGYMSKEEALASLREMTGQDFGFDVEKWKEWYKANSKKLRSHL